MTLKLPPSMSTMAWTTPIRRRRQRRRCPRRTGGVRDRHVRAPARKRRHRQAYPRQARRATSREYEFGWYKGTARSKNTSVRNSKNTFLVRFTATDTNSVVPSRYNKHNSNTKKKGTGGKKRNKEEESKRSMPKSRVI